MKGKDLILLASVAFAAFLLGTSPASAQVPPDLGAAGNFAILAGTAVTCTTSDVIGDVGVYPGTAVTQTSCKITGTVHAGDGDAQAAANAFLAAYAAIGAPPDPDPYPCTGNLLAAYTDTTLTLTPGVYCSEAEVVFTNTTLTLEGDGVWIFRIGTAMTPGFPGYLTGTNFTVVMNGGSPCNVYWWVDAAVTLTDSNFRGVILGGEAITVTRGSFGGDALAKAAVTLTGANLGGCVGATPPGNPPTAQHFLVDHFQCYEVKPEDKVESHKVVLQDQFGKTTVTTRRPWLICTPTVKDADPKKVVGKFPDDLINPIDHLVCYDLSKGGHGGKDRDGNEENCEGGGHGGRQEVLVENQFGKQRLTVKEPQMLCLPSLKTLRDGGGHGGGHDDDDDDDDDDDNRGRRGK